MSEKRFVYHEEHFPLNVREIIDNENGETYDCEDATDVLNELFDENKYLKEENEKLIQKKCLPCELVNLQTREIDKLKKENEQLKKECKIAVDEMVTDYKKLEKENEQLRKELNDCEKFRYAVFKRMEEIW